MSFRIKKTFIYLAAQPLTDTYEIYTTQFLDIIGALFNIVRKYKCSSA